VTLIPANTTLEYSALHEALVHAGVVVALAELHGGVCASLSAGGAAAAQRWLEDCFADQTLAETSDLAAALNELIGQTWRALEGGELAFEPLLPDDEAPLDEQVQALALWCHGFLGGLGASAPDFGGQGDAVLAEIISDFSEISRAALSEAEAAGQDQPDFALAELQEHVRVSAQIVFEALAARRAAARDVH
jgi:uncharacterized protein YgfB (UPF0149 family)